MVACGVAVAALCTEDGVGAAGERAADLGASWYMMIRSLISRYRKHSPSWMVYNVTIPWIPTYLNI